jgi:hypothetical protein
MNEARVVVHLDDDGIHRRQGCVMGLDDQADALVQLSEVWIGDDAGDLDDLVVLCVQTGHLQVDPDQAIRNRHPLLLDAGGRTRGHVLVGQRVAEGIARLLDAK